MVGHYRSIYQYITPHRWYTIVRNTTKCFLFDRADGYLLIPVESWLNFGHICTGSTIAERESWNDLVELLPGHNCFHTCF